MAVEDAVVFFLGLELELAGGASAWIFSIVNNGFLLIYMCTLASTERIKHRECYSTHTHTFSFVIS